MRNVLAATLAALFVLCIDSWADVGDVPMRTMPHQEECTAPLPKDFWEAPAAKPFQSAEAWAWNESICLGQWADMRNAPGGSGNGEECQPAEIEKKGEEVPAYREVRPEFLELILSHQPWASAPRHPQVVIRCALVRGDIELDDHELAPTFGFHQGKIDGDVSLLGTRIDRSFSLQGSTVTGRLNADRLEVGGGLFLRDGATFGDIDLIGARIAGNAELSGSTVTGRLDADRLEVGGGLLLRDGATFGDIDLIGARIAGSVDLSGSAVTGMLNANRSEVRGGLFLNDGTFADISLLGARIAGVTVLIDSTVTGMLNADGLEVGGNLFLRGGGTFARIRLLGARIAGDADLVGSTVTGMLNADGLEVGGRLLLRDGGTFADINLVGAAIASDAELSGSTVTGKLDADGLEVGGHLHLRNGTFADIDLLGARIVGDANLISSTVTGKLAADGVEIGGSLFLRNGGTFADINLLGAKIGGTVQLVGSTFGGEINLTGAAIGGELLISSGSFKSSPTWLNGASLILRNAKADVLQARGDSWNMSERDGLLPTDLTGFIFNRLGGIDTSGGASMGDESADFLIGWIGAQRDFGDNYDPQPYTQLAQVLEAAGATDKANAIRYAKFEHKRDHDISMNTFRSAALTIKRLSLGYGVYPFRLLYWFGGLVVLGWLLAQFSKKSSVRRWMGLWYSLENALPLIETNERFSDLDHGRPWLAHFFHAQKVLGFVLATVLVGALTLLSG